MYGHMGGMGFGLGFLNFIGTILFFVAVFWALRFFFRGGMHRYRHGNGKYGKWREWRGRYGGPRPWEGRSDGAEQTLRERLAKGEIDQDEFNRLKTQLSGNGGGNSGGNGNANGGSGGGPRPEGGPLGWLRGDDALEVARLRLAKGEISADEFETLRRVLSS